MADRARVLREPGAGEGGRRRALAAVLGAALGGVLALPTPALALGGGGSGGFGGGGGGGGFGGGGFGMHGIIFGPAWLVIVVLLLRFAMAAYRRDAMQRRRDGRPPLTFGIALSLLALWLLWPFAVAAERWRRRRRVARVRLAAAEASEEDPMFAPDVVERAGEALFRDIQAAWSRDDRERLAALVGETLMTEWNARLGDFARRGWRNEVDVIGDVRVEYVGLVNLGDERSEVCVRIAARVRDIVRDEGGGTVRRRGSVAETHRVCQYWTLGRRDGRWVLVRIQERREGMHELRAPIVATPWSDDERLRREALVEQASESLVPASAIAAIARPAIDEDARLAALDLSLVDGRFAPDVLAGEARYAVAAWVTAIDGDRAALREIADERAIGQLLYPDGPATRLVVRGLDVGEVRIVEVAAGRVPPTMTVEVHAAGIVYTEDRATLIVVRGDRALRRGITLRWLMELRDAGTHPWRIVEICAPGQEPPAAARLESPPAASAG
ncbi:MAG TPA: TIM44-like domain-containing protein [Solirubrobacteraceae bacterium]|nr:TIM44-like domain-containing protein [Solirubrobacteraceae bacterium]